MRKYITLSVALLLTPTAFAQQKNFQNNGFYANEIAQVCKGAEAMSDQEVIDLITTICEKTNNKNRFVIAPCGNISNCQATLYNNKPYIMYNTQFLNSVKGLQFTNSSLPKEQVDWKVITLLAHEVAHHVYMHLINPDPDMTQRQMELEADEFAGYTIYMLGGSLENAQAIMHTVSVSDKGSYTHPPRAQRLDAIARGYMQGQRTFPDKNEHITPSVTATDAQIIDELKTAEKHYNADSYSKAFPVFQKHADSKHFTPKYSVALGFMYQLGLGTSINDIMSEVYYKKAAEAGYAEGQIMLGLLYKMQEKYSEAMSWFKKAVDNGNIDAFIHISNLYYDGGGVTQSYSQAIYWLTLAIDKGSVAAQYNLAYMYENGKGVSTDLAKAKSLYQEAAKKGYKSAQEACKRLGITW